MVMITASVRFGLVWHAHVKKRADAAVSNVVPAAVAVLGANPAATLVIAVAVVKIGDRDNLSLVV